MAESPPSQTPSEVPPPQTSPPQNSAAQTTAAQPTASPPGDALGGKEVSFDLPPDTVEDPSAASGIDQSDIDELLKQAQFEDVATASADGNPFSGADGFAAASPPVDTQPLDLPNFQQVMQDAQVSSIDLLRDVELNVKIELGRSRMLVEDVLKLGEGSVVELDKLAGDPVDVFVNDRLVARGEVLVLNDNFCVRVNEIVAGLKEEAV
jgi:flagellar motor switch protein FliN/FliY